MLELLVVAGPLRQSRKGRWLHRLRCCTRRSRTYVLTSRKPRLGYPKLEIVPPAFQVPVQLFNPLRDGLKTLSMISHLGQLAPLLLQCLRRPAHVPISPLTPLQVVIVSKREPRKLQTRSCLLQIHHARLLPIDLQPQPAFQFRLDPAPQTTALIARQHHEIVGMPHHLGLRPLSRGGAPPGPRSMFSVFLRASGSPRQRDLAPPCENWGIVTKRLLTAMGCYAAIALAAGLTLDGKFRLGVWIFLAYLAVRTGIAYKAGW